MSFDIRIEGGDRLELTQIWPDHDAPENPTAADVAEVIAAGRGGLGFWLRDWCMEPTVRVYVDDVEVKF